MFIFLCLVQLFGFTDHGATVWINPDKVVSISKYKAEEVPNGDYKFDGTTEVAMDNVNWYVGGTPDEVALQQLTAVE